MTNQEPSSRRVGLDHWIVGQLRAQVLQDIKEFVPAECFEQADISPFVDAIPNSKHLSYEMRWGRNAGMLGRRLTFETPKGLTARQVSASEILMHLGLLASTQAAFDASKGLDRLAKEKGITIQNPNLEQLPHSLVQLEKNLTDALAQYLRFLPEGEREPFQRLLSPQENVTLPSPSDYLTQFPAMQINNYGTIGAFQTGPNATANVQQQWSLGEGKALAEALLALSQAIRSSQDDRLTPSQREALAADIESKSRDPQAVGQDKSKFMTWLAGIATIIQVVDGLKPALELVQGAAQAFFLLL